MMSQNSSNSLGDSLRQGRLVKKVSLGQASQDTRIHADVLSSLEENRFEKLGSVYAKGFLKLYAKYLGLNVDEIVARFVQEYASKPDIAKKPRLVIPAANPFSQPAKQTEAKSRPVKQSRAITPAKTLQISIKQPLIVFVAAGAVIFLGLVGIQKITKAIRARSEKSKRVESVKGRAPAKVKPKKAVTSNKPSKPALDPVSTKKPAEESVKKAVVPVLAPSKATPVPTASMPAPADATKKNISAAGDQIVLVIKAREKNWIQVKSDGQVVFQGILPKGSSERWQALDKIELWLGNAGAVQLELNGRMIEKIGRNGQTLRNVLITKDGLVVSSR